MKTVLSILIFGIVAQALGSPSRAGIMTGRYAIRDGLANKTITATDQRGLPDRTTTVASMLRDNGYRTGLVGKWHLGHTPQHWPTTQGFDYYYGLPYCNNQTPLARSHSRRRHLKRHCDEHRFPADAAGCNRSCFTSGDRT